MGKITRSRVTDTVDTESEDYTEETTESAPAAPRKVNRAVSSGWGAPAEERRETVQVDKLILKGNGKRIIKLLDDEPPVKYKRHYIRSAGQNGRYYTCLLTECPLCEKGARASWTYKMNVVDLTDDPTKVLMWEFGNEVATQLQSLAEEGALTDFNRYFQVYHEKIANRDAPATRVQKLKARDLEEDYGILPLNEDEIATLEQDCHGEETVFVNTRDYLEEVQVMPGDLPQKRK